MLQRRGPLIPTFLLLPFLPLIQGFEFAYLCLILMLQFVAVPILRYVYDYSKLQAFTALYVAAVPFLLLWAVSVVPTFHSVGFAPSPEADSLSVGASLSRLSSSSRSELSAASRVVVRFFRAFSLATSYVTAAYSIYFFSSAVDYLFLVLLDPLLELVVSVLAGDSSLRQPRMGLGALAAACAPALYFYNQSSEFGQWAPLVVGLVSRFAFALCGRMHATWPVLLDAGALIAPASWMSAFYIGEDLVSLASIGVGSWVALALSAALLLLSRVYVHFSRAAAGRTVLWFAAEWIGAVFGGIYVLASAQDLGNFRALALSVGIFGLAMCHNQLVSAMPPTRSIFLPPVIAKQVDGNGPQNPIESIPAALPPKRVTIQKAVPVVVAGPSLQNAAFVSIPVAAVHGGTQSERSAPPDSDDEEQGEIMSFK